MGNSIWLFIIETPCVVIWKKITQCDLAKFDILVGADDDDEYDAPDLVESLDEVNNNEADVAAPGVEDYDVADAADGDEDEKSSPSALPSGDISIRLL